MSQVPVAELPTCPGISRITQVKVLVRIYADTVIVPSLKRLMEQWPKRQGTRGLKARDFQQHPVASGK